MPTKRTVESRLSDLEPDADDRELGYKDGVEYLRHVKEVDESDDDHVALSRSMYFGRDAGPGEWMDTSHIEERLYEEWPLFRVVSDADYLDPDEKFAFPMVWASSFFPPEYNDAAVNQWWKRLPEHKQEHVERALVQLSDDSTGDDDS